VLADDRPRYSSYFEDLLASPLLLYFRESGYRQYVTQYLVSKLSRLFSWDMNPKDKFFIQILEYEIIQLYFSPEKKPKIPLLELTGRILSSQTVREAYSYNELTPVDFDLWKEEIFFVPLERLHGVTLLVGLCWSTANTQSTIEKQL